MSTNFFCQETCEPGELAALKQVFDEITTQPWFDTSQENKESFARYLFETMPVAQFEPAKHKSIVEASARMFYSRDPD